MELNDISFKIIGSAYKVHKALGSGLLESTYEACLAHDLIKEGLKVEQQRLLPVYFDCLTLDTGYRIDLFVEGCVIVELKSVAAIEAIHKAQVLTYLKLSNAPLGLLLNFNVMDMKKGITRLVHGDLKNISDD